MINFQDREVELNLILKSTNRVIHIYGESGVGKTELLTRVEASLGNLAGGHHTLRIDLQKIKQEDKPDFEILQDRFLADLQRKSNVISTLNQKASIEQRLAFWVNLYIKVVEDTSFIILDASEVFQENMAFWGWLEADLFRPFLRESDIRFILAGRIPVPWRKPDVRRVAIAYQLTSLPEQYISILAREVLGRLPGKTVDEYTRLIQKYACGHPKLTIEMAEFLLKQKKSPVNFQFEQQICRDFIWPFIEDKFFEGLQPNWKEILKNISVLPQFNIFILRYFINHVNQNLLRDMSEYDLIQKLSELRLQNTVILEGSEGDQLHGTIGMIVLHCFQTAEPEKYIKALGAAQATMKDVAAQFEPGDPECKMYLDHAEKYAQEIKTHAQ